MQATLIRRSLLYVVANTKQGLYSCSMCCTFTFKAFGKCVLSKGTCFINATYTLLCFWCEN